MFPLGWQLLTTSRCCDKILFSMAPYGLGLTSVGPRARWHHSSHDHYHFWHLLPKSNVPEFSSLISLFKMIKKILVSQNPTDNICRSWSHILAPWAPLLSNKRSQLCHLQTTEIGRLHIWTLARWDQDAKRLSVEQGCFLTRIGTLYVFLHGQGKAWAHSIKFFSKGHLFCCVANP